MPRKLPFYSSQIPFHVYARCNNKEEFQLDLRKVWNIFENDLWLLTRLYGFHLHYFTLMPNHYHAILSTPLDNRSVGMQWFQRETAQKVNFFRNKMNHLWGGRYRAQAIWDPFHYAVATKYVIRNPVKASLCGKVEEYKFSSLAQVIGNYGYTIPMFPHPWAKTGFIPNTLSDFLKWANTPFNKDIEDSIKPTLKRKSFKLPKYILEKKKTISVI